MSIPTPNYRTLDQSESELYKYKLREAFYLQLDEGFRPVANQWVERQWVGINVAGCISFATGYQWDGASGPAIATTDWITASLVHDGLYQLMKEKRLSIKWRKAADREMLRILKAAGMPWWRRRISYMAVRIAGGRIIRRAWKENGLNG